MYEYIRLEMDWGDLSELNQLGSAGWRVVAVQPNWKDHNSSWVLLERKDHIESGGSR